MGAIADDDSLETWVKHEEPMIAIPPPNMGLVGWRDPYIFETKSPKDGQHEWGMLLGSGIKGKGGAVMIYRSEDLKAGKASNPFSIQQLPCHCGKHSTPADGIHLSSPVALLHSDGACQ